MTGVASKNVDQSDMHTKVDVTLDDGRTGTGDKQSGFLGLQDSNDKDTHIATTRAVKDANSKPEKE